MLIRMFAFVWLCLCSLAASATPNGVPVPKAAYSAGGKECTEIDMQGMQSVMILRPDRQLGWTLMPARLKT